MASRGSRRIRTRRARANSSTDNARVSTGSRLAFLSSNTARRILQPLQHPLTTHDFKDVENARADGLTRHGDAGRVNECARFDAAFRRESAQGLLDRARVEPGGFLEAAAPGVQMAKHIRA